LNFSTETV